MPDLLLLAEFKLNDPTANSGVFALGRPPAFRHRNVAPGTRDRGAAVPEHKDESRVNSIIIVVAICETLRIRTVSAVAHPLHDLGEPRIAALGVRAD
jgi:hypothetical protein